MCDVGMLFLADYQIVLPHESSEPMSKDRGGGRNSVATIE